MFEGACSDSSDDLRPHWIPIAGSSMWPALRAGDLAELCPLRSEVRRGDVLVIRTEASLVVHRVRAISADGQLLLRGDSCTTDDAPIAPSLVLGRVQRVRRGARTLLPADWDTRLNALGSAGLRLRRRLSSALGRAA